MRCAFGSRIQDVLVIGIPLCKYSVMNANQLGICDVHLFNKLINHTFYFSQMSVWMLYKLFVQDGLKNTPPSVPNTQRI